MAGNHASGMVRYRHLRSFKLRRLTVLVGYHASASRVGRCMERFPMRLRDVCAAMALLASNFVAPQTFAAGDSPRCAVPAGTVPFEFASDGNLLRGFIDRPTTAGRHPAIVIVHGSGTTDITRGGGPYNGSYEEM